MNKLLEVQIGILFQLDEGRIPRDLREAVKFSHLICVLNDTLEHLALSTNKVL